MDFATFRPGRPVPPIALSLIDFLLRPFRSSRAVSGSRADAMTEPRALLAALRQCSPVVLGVTESVRRRLLRRYLDASQRNVPMHVLALAVLLFGVVDAASGLERSAAFAVLAAVISLRWWLADRTLDAMQRGRRGSTCGHDVLLLATLLGWGLSPWLVTALVPDTNFFALCFIAMVAIGINSMTYLSALPASLACITGGLGMLSLAMASHGSPAGWSLAAGTALTGIAIMRWMRVNHRSTLRMLNTERENRSLIAELQSVQQRMALENRKLGESLKDVNEAAERDALTGAFNRKYLTGIAAPLGERVRHHAEPISVCMIDVDHFKRINDRHGHAVGDAVLKTVVEHLNNRLREADRLARYGGEEFVLILRRCEIGRGMRVAEALRNHIASLQMDFGDAFVQITASIGIARWHPSETLDAVMERADRALYVAKRSGRDRVQIDVDDAHDASLEPSGPAPMTTN